MKAIRFRGKGDDRQFRIDNLPPIVRGYMSLEFVLGSPVIKEEEKAIIQQDMANTIKNMNLREQAHLLMHKRWLMEKGVRK